MKKQYWICDGYPFKSADDVKRFAIREKVEKTCTVQWLTYDEYLEMGYAAVGEDDPQYQEY